MLMAGAKLNPSSPGMLSNLATVRSDLGEWKGAAGTWRRALALTPSDAGRYSSAAASLQRGTRPADVIPFLRSASALDPTNWQRHYALAHACLEMAFLTRSVEMAVAGQVEAAKVAAEAAEAAARAAAGDSGSASASARLWLRLWQTVAVVQAPLSRRTSASRRPS